MPTENQAYINEQYAKFMKERQEKKEAERLKEEAERKKNAPPPPPPGKSPLKLGQKRSVDSTVTLTTQVNIKGGNFWFGTQMDIGGKIIPSKLLDGSQPKELAHV